MWLKVGIIISVMLLIYWQDLGIIFSHTTKLAPGNISNYIVILPFLIGYILYRKRKILGAAVTLKEKGKIDGILGLVLCLLAVVIFFIGSSTTYELNYHLYSLPVFMAGSTLLMFNMTTLRQAFFPIILLTYLVPIPGELFSEIAADMSWVDAVAVQEILSNFGVPITLQPDVGAPALLAGHERMTFYVGEPSSGIYSMLGLTLFALFVSYISIGPLWKKLAIFALGMPLYYLLNIVRIASIVSLWYGYGTEVAESFHLVGGIILVAGGSMILLFISDRLIKVGLSTLRSAREPCDTCSKCLEVGESFCLYCGRQLKALKQRIEIKDVGRISAIVFIALLVFLPEIESQLGSSASKQPNLLDLKLAQSGEDSKDLFLPEINGWYMHYAYTDLRIQEALNLDVANVYTYGRNESSNYSPGNSVVSPIIYSTIQVSTGIHDWESSLVNRPSKIGRPTADVIVDKDVNVIQDTKARLFVYQRPYSDATEIVLYWYKRMPFLIDSNVENRNVQISLWTYADTLAKYSLINGPTDTVGIEKTMMSFAKPVAQFWDAKQQMHVQQSFMGTLFSQYSRVFTAAILLPAAILSVYVSGKNRKINSALGRLYENLVPEEREIIDSVDHLKSRGVSKITGKSIAETYSKLANKTINSSTLIGILSSARQIGILRSIIIDDKEPLLIWKTKYRRNNKFSWNIIRLRLPR